MSLHQVIFTSCKRGIDGVNDGQQVYSYDSGFTDNKDREVLGLFNYIHPDIPFGASMSDEYVATFPKSFVYRKLSLGRHAIALNTYLGRDYMGDSGRYGNTLGHAIIGEAQDFNVYPCELFGTGALRDRMSFEEVNSDSPDYLPVPELTRGYSVNIDSVTEFLSVEGRMEIMKNILHAVLTYEETKKRIIICDEPENIIMWIAAVDYTLPLNMALEISFTTYDYNPNISESMIIGVRSQNTAYSDSARNSNFVFDIISGNCDNFDKDERYYGFLDMAMSFSYDSLKDFHRFLKDKCNLMTADTKIFSAYRLYTLLSGGMTELADSELAEALDFCNKHTNPAVKKQALDCILSNAEYLIDADDSTFFLLMDYVTTAKAGLEQDYFTGIKNLIVDKVMGKFLITSIDENEFNFFFEQITALSRRFNFGIASELMKAENQQKLLRVMDASISTWKYTFITKVVSGYVKEKSFPFSDIIGESPLGMIYSGIVRSAYASASADGFSIVTFILQEYAGDCKFLVNVAINLEKILSSLPEGEKDVRNMWDTFGRLMFRHHKNNLRAAYNIFGGYGRDEQINLLYNLAMQNAMSPQELQGIFEEHYEYYVSKDAKYAAKYKAVIITDYYSKLKTYGIESSYGPRMRLFNLMNNEKYSAPFSVELVRELVSVLPYSEFSEEQVRFIKTAFDYQHNMVGEPISGKLLLLTMALVLDNCRDDVTLHSAYAKLSELIRESGKGCLTNIGMSLVEEYFGWLLPHMCNLCRVAKDFHFFYCMFDMSADIAAYFFSSCAKIYLKQCKEEKSNDVFCEFLAVVFRVNNSAIRQEIGKVLCKLNRQRMSELDSDVKDRIYHDRELLRQWDEIRNAADSTNPLLNGIGSFFKRKKNDN